jgi:hypothetical protein
MLYLAAMVSHVSPERTRWNLSQSAGIPGCVGPGTVPVVVVVVTVLDVVVVVAVVVDFDVVTVVLVVLVGPVTVPTTQ